MKNIILKTLYILLVITLAASNLTSGITWAEKASLADLLILFATGVNIIAFLLLLPTLPRTKYGIAIILFSLSIIGLNFCVFNHTNEMDIRTTISILNFLSIPLTSILAWLHYRKRFID